MSNQFYQNICSQHHQLQLSSLSTLYHKFNYSKLTSSATSTHFTPPLSRHPFHAPRYPVACNRCPRWRWSHTPLQPTINRHRQQQRRQQRIVA